MDRVNEGLEVSAFPLLYLRNRSVPYADSLSPRLHPIPKAELQVVQNTSTGFFVSPRYHASKRISVVRKGKDNFALFFPQNFAGKGSLEHTCEQLPVPTSRFSRYAFPYRIWYDRHWRRRTHGKCSSDGME